MKTIFSGKHTQYRIVETKEGYRVQICAVGGEIWRTFSKVYLTLYAAVHEVDTFLDSDRGDSKYSDHQEISEQDIIAYV